MTNNTIINYINDYKHFVLALLEAHITELNDNELANEHSNLSQVWREIDNIYAKSMERRLKNA